jgi:AcrR family transcriptional regulator
MAMRPPVRTAGSAAATGSTAGAGAAGNAGTAGNAAAKAAAKATARERLLDAADELFYREGVLSVGIDRIIDHAGVAKASLYNTFGSKESLVCAYLARRHERSKARITRVLTRFRTPREKLLGVFDALGEQLTDPGYHGCAFQRASAEAPQDSGIVRQTDAYRSWLCGLFTTLATEAGYADPAALGRQLQLLYDGAGTSARLDRDPSASTTARTAAAALLAAAPLASATETI